MTKNFSIVETKRLILRRWRPEDLDAFAEMNADPRVMEYFLAPHTRAETENMMSVMNGKMDQYGFGFWAAELKVTGELTGFIGINVPSYPLPFSPCVEVGWRLAHRFWGQGLAPEGALACLDYGFVQLKLPEIVAFTATGNLKSRRVMEKIGMTYDARDDFDNPRVPEGHPLRRHVLYRVRSY